MGKRKVIVNDIDKRIIATVIPSMISLAIVPVVTAIDTFWVGRLGSALALAGQEAANQTFFTLYFLIKFLPQITAPIVASAVSRGDNETAQKKIGEILFLSNVLGGIGTLLLVLCPRQSLSLVLEKNAPAIKYALPCLRLRALALIPALFSQTGFAVYRGLLNTVTPLKVSLVSNTLNLIADPLLIFGLSMTGVASNGMGVAGAALATTGSELVGGLIYLKLLLQRKLLKMSHLLKAPRWMDIKPLIQGGLAVLAHQALLNTAFVTATRRAQSMDPSGVSGAAYGIAMQIFGVGLVAHIAIETTAAALVSSAQVSSGKDSARNVANRIFSWSSLVGCLLAGIQVALLPKLIPMFSNLPEVQQAVKGPAIISAFIHILNGPVYAGEGTMLGLGRFKALASITALGVSTMVLGVLSPIGNSINGILLSRAALSAVQAICCLVYHMRIGPLRRGS